MEKISETYTFKVKLIELENYIWRDIEVTSVSTITKLACAILAAFNATANHLFCVYYGEKSYSIGIEEDEESVNSSKVTLDSLGLSVGDGLTMDYDFGEGWEFDIELISIEKDTQSDDPRITDGAGCGIIEDSNVETLISYIKQTNRTDQIPTYYDANSDNEVEWDYRNFDVDVCNATYKDKIEVIEKAYNKRLKV